MYGMWLRLELRRRWRSLIVLTLLIAFATGTVLAAVAGARRGATAIDRLTAVTLPFDAVVVPSIPGFDWEKVRALPSVAALMTIPFVPAYEIVDPPGVVPDLPPTGDPSTWRTIEKPVVLEGRLPAPGRVDEAVILPKFTETYGRAVGDTVTIRLTTPEAVDAVLSEGPAGDLPYAGPTLTMRIVGVIRSPWFSDTIMSRGEVIFPPALFAKYRDNMVGTKGLAVFQALVRLKDGPQALPAFKRELAQATGRSSIDVWPGEDMKRSEQRFLMFQSLTLLAFGLAVLAAAIVLIGQSVSRYTAAAVAELHQLRAVGMTPRQVAGAASLGPALAATAGAVLSVAGAYTASAWMPIGAAALLEPSPGLDFDPQVLIPGALAVPVAVGLASALAAAALGRLGPRPARRSAAATLAARANLPVPAVVGTRFALEPGRGKGSVPVRPALLGTVVGVLGVLAAFTFSSGVTDAGERPERFGQTFDAGVYLAQNGKVPADDAVRQALARHPDVTGVTGDMTAIAQSGATAVAVHSFDQGAKALPVVVSEGRLPRDDRELMLAVKTAEALGARVGDEIPLTGDPGKGTFRVSGIGFVPKGAHNEYFDGGMVTPAGFETLFDSFKFYSVLYAVRPGVDPASLMDTVNAVPGVTFAMFEEPVPLVQLAQVRDLRFLPVLLAGFLALLAVGAVGHVLATAVRRRSHEVAVMRALGLTRRQARWVVVTQASVLALIGLLFGVPLGVALGRTLWRLVADQWPFAYHPPVAFWALLAVGPLALLISNALAVWPGRLAARLRVGQVLRAE
ncbi:hypothetical protein Aph01nite_39270 [Acrocarpospora phusangensis]|uniref:ABC3 transporter permease protein domain-containing protein n=1 Tax=Acrocarpospora phusangensis TaxID=1070424 RepID=A0A919QG48_9ACTN|nr:FtsX-like permease family protein [Acrocarpospora phusangensis]GIH25617.1 hypothetical protein Aph01nite_39270 [Acrocarpospora phusangensis]